MFFVLSKLLDVAVSPLVWAMVLVVAGLLARPGVRGERALRWSPLAGLLVLYFFSIEPVSNALWRSLEAPPLTTARPDVEYDAAVILGGMVDDRAMALYGLPSYNDNIERLLAARDLAVKNRAKVLLLSGGDGNPQGGALAPEARLLARQLEDWGVDPARLVVEDQSRNTRENAVESAKIIRERGYQRVLLVTSAFHMRRALGCFRAVGLTPDTLSVDFRSSNGAFGLGQLLPRTGPLNTSAAAIRELLGRAVYRARGYATPVD